MGERELRERIEAVRLELNRLADQMGVMAAGVLAKSKQLDELLNQYKRIREREDK
ncbi:Spo0E family sporulation regulatory protein-aspartic acid phosphatase [Paenibacillus sp. 1P07SE]|uniref:Spo0E family sporulation regulatory protein-aspartic acid phosphatase n=1 Tax=Paenibacillus sp. 1P07SE TaxID=3132209 RepID=UPI0039A68984